MRRADPGDVVQRIEIARLRAQHGVIARDAFLDTPLPEARHRAAIRCVSTSSHPRRARVGRYTAASSNRPRAASAFTELVVSPHGKIGSMRSASSYSSIASSTSGPPCVKRAAQVRVDFDRVFRVRAARKCRDGLLVSPLDPERAAEVVLRVREVGSELECALQVLDRASTSPSTSRAFPSVCSATGLAASPRVCARRARGEFLHKRVVAPWRKQKSTSATTRPRRADLKRAASASGAVRPEPHDREMPIERDVRVAIGVRLAADLHETDHGDERAEVPQPADEQVGSPARRATRSTDADGDRQRAASARRLRAAELAGSG